MRGILVACAAVMIGLGGSGCARMTATTEIKPDGSWTRTGTFRGAPTTSKPGAMAFTPKIRDVFALPEGKDWKTSVKRESEEVIYTAVREMAKGESLKDDVVLKAKGVPRQIDNEVSVREISPGRIEYRETLHWRGEKIKELEAGEPQLEAQVRKALPAGVPGDPEIKSLSVGMMREFWLMLFGPSDPLISSLAMHPDLIERKIRFRFGKAVSQAVAAKLGDKLTFDQRTALVRKIVDSMMDKVPLGKQTESMNGGGLGGALGPAGVENMNFVAMLFVAKMPGRIISTNGEADESTGEVYWAFYSPAVAVGDLTMTAVCEVGK